MKLILLSSEILASIGMGIVFLSPIVFLVGLIMMIVSSKNKKIGLKLLIGSIIAFVIGFGTCLANLGSLH